MSFYKQLIRNILNSSFPLFSCVDPEYAKDFGPFFPILGRTSTARENRLYLENVLKVESE
jgi:hypothetical protein